MKSTFALTLAFTAFAGAAFANPEVGGAPMFEDKNIVENAVNSADHTTLVAAVQAAGLVETLQGAGPFTVGAQDARCAPCGGRGRLRGRAAPSAR